MNRAHRIALLLIGAALLMPATLGTLHVYAEGDTAWAALFAGVEIAFVLVGCTVDWNGAVAADEVVA